MANLKFKDLTNSTSITSDVAYSGYVPNTIGYKGATNPNLKWSAPVIIESLQFYGKTKEDGVFVISSPSFGSARCKTKFLADADIELLGDALAEAVESKLEVCLGRGPQSNASWFFAVLPASAAPDVLQEQGALDSNPRPWAGFGQ